MHARHPHARHPDTEYAGYAELHCLTNFSFLRGASHPEELVSRAAQLGYRAIAITDECSMAGVVKAHVTAMELGIHLIIGSEFRFDDGVHLVLLATDRQSYGRISHLITVGRRRAGKGEYRLSIADLERCPLGGVLAIWFPEAETPGQQQVGEHLQSLFDGDVWLGVEIFPDGRDISRYEQAFELSTSLAMPMVAAGDVHMHLPDRKPLLDVLSAVRIHQSVRTAGRLLFANREKYLRPLSLLEKMYPAALLEETVRIARRCHFSLAELRYEYPEELVPPGLTPTIYLRQLTEAGVRKRWPDGEPASVRALIEKELSLIAELEYEYYFLTVYDVVQFARSNGILCQGRGSAANSAVCFCLEITEVDPSRMSLLFERFISKERGEPPDIDVDFEHQRREEVIQYIYKKYSRERAAIAATVVTYRPKSAVRDVGKALGLDPGLVDRLAKSLSWWDKRDELLSRFEEAGVSARNPVISQFVTLVDQILGFPRHLSQHVGGFVISSGPLSHLVPVENAAMPERTIIQWDKDDLESLGLLKVDVLALGMLTAIRKSIHLINEYRGTDLELATIPAEDPATYEMLCRGDSVGVFQVESRAQMSMLPRLKPREFYDLVVEVAIVRPGPIQGDMVHPYLRRRNGEEPVTYANEAVKGVLERTLGVPIFQEQVIKLAVVAAGFEPGEADQLRRAMAAWKRRGGLEEFHQKIVQGMLARGHDRDFAERIFAQIKGFGDYGFPESHAASFALLVYFSAWLKQHEPAAFYCGLLNSQPMGFYSPSQLVQDAMRHDVEVRPVDILASDWESTLEAPLDGCHSPAIRLGLQRIKGLKADTAGRIVAARRLGHITSLDTLARSAALDRGDLARLTEGGALKNLSGHRYQTHWEAQALQPDAPLGFAQCADTSPVYLPAPTEREDLCADYASIGLTLGRHPMAMLRADRDFADLRTARDLETINHGRFVRIAGLVTGRQRPSTASGVLFVTLEDEFGNINVVVWTRVLDRFRAEILQGRLLRIKGVLEREGSVIHVIAGHVENLTFHLDEFETPSRDFR